MSVTDAIKKFEAALEADASHLLDEFRSLVGKLTGEAETDAADVAHLAETAAQPVVKTAEADAGQVAQHAAADAEAAVTGEAKA